MDPIFRRVIFPEKDVQNISLYQICMDSGVRNLFRFAYPYVLSTGTEGTVEWM